MNFFKFLFAVSLFTTATFNAQAQQSSAQSSGIPAYPPLPAGLLVEPPAHYLKWKCDTSFEDQSLFFTEYTPSYSYHVLSYEPSGYDSTAMVIVSCFNYANPTTPTQELETALRLFESVDWDSIEYFVPIKGSLKQQHKRNVSLPENSQLIRATKGDRQVDLTVYPYDKRHHYQIFAVYNKLFSQDMKCPELVRGGHTNSSSILKQFVQFH